MVLLLALAAAALVASCDKVPLFAPSGTTIRLFTNTQVLPLNGTAEITASVLETGGNPVQNGTRVTFTTSLGTISPSEIGTTDGKATVAYFAGTQSGTAVINAFSGSSSTSSSTATGTGGTTTTTGSGVSILIGAAAATTVVVTASPSSVSQLGGSSVITASVLDANNNGLGGVPVSFSTDQGSLSPVTATTNTSGLAQTTLTTNQTATVTVTVGTKTGTAKVTAVAVPTITIAGPSTTPTAGLTTIFTLNVTPGSGSAPIRNVNVDFGDGTNVGLGAASGSVSLPHVYRDSGTFTVTAIATDASGQNTSMSIPVVIFPAVPFALTVTAPSGKSGVAMTLTATPGAGAPVIVSYNWNFGDGQSAITTTGSAPHIYVLPAGTTVAQQFIVTVTATGADGRTGVASTFVTITP
jgi:Bacterial Ig-like domain (group 1)/PKD domain